MESSQGRVVGRIADQLLAHRPGHPLRIAVDGITAAGKTTFARALVAALNERGRPAIQLTMDGFHHPRAHRHRQGRDSAVGYYPDAYDFPAFAGSVLRPLGPDGDRRYRTRIIDLATDQPIDEPPVSAPDDAVLVVDGSFLQRDLAGLWDEVVFLEVDFAAARARGTRRDAGQFGGAEAAGSAYDSRYHAANRLYLSEVDPVARAPIVVGNDDVRHPVLRRIGGTPATEVRLFSYGTLRFPRVQRARFGRELDGVPDTLPGHRADWVTITDPEVVAVSGTDRHPIVRPSADPADSVPGSVLTLTTAELAAADDYEVDDYRRVAVTLESGADAWVYLAGVLP